MTHQDKQDLIRRYLSANEQAKLALKKAESLKAQLKEIMDPDTSITLEGDPQGRAVSLDVCGRVSLDQKALLRKYPKIHNELQKTTKFAKLTVKFVA